VRRLRRSDLADSRWGGPSAALAALLALAAALRLVGIRYGLPHALLNPDERNIVPRAWAMTHGAGADPDWFDYPTLGMYLLAPFQAWHDEPSYLTARLVMVGLALACVAAAWWLGLKAYGMAAGFVAAAATAVATTHVAYSRMAVTDIPLTLGVTVALALMVIGRIELAGIAVGLATSAKYPGLLLLAPLVAVTWGRWRQLAVAGGLAVLAFALTSPYVILRLGDASGDALRVQRAAREGWLGFEDDHAAPIAFGTRLWDAMGPALLVGVAGLVLALVFRTQADRALATFSLVYFAQLLTVDAHFDRYVLPLVPALGALAGRLRSLAPVTALLLVIPLTWSIRDARELRKQDARVAAHDWIEANLPQGATLAVDPSLPDFDGFRLVHLRLPRPGDPHDANRSVGRLRSTGVDYVVLTGAVEDRVLAAADHYPRESAFVRDARRDGRRVFRIAPNGRFGGHWVEVYRL
jgi:4-amino-4-deoxy-L-arabinose transferase-like glycosyltransferase